MYKKISTKFYTFLLSKNVNLSRKGADYLLILIGLAILLFCILVFTNPFADLFAIDDVPEDGGLSIE